MTDDWVEGLLEDAGQQFTSVFSVLLIIKGRDKLHQMLAEKETLGAFVWHGETNACLP